VLGHRDTVMTNLHGVGDCAVYGTVQVFTYLARLLTPDFLEVGRFNSVTHVSVPKNAFRRAGPNGVRYWWH
jgi:hypothetical protein